MNAPESSDLALASSAGEEALLIGFDTHINGEDCVCSKQDEVTHAVGAPQLTVEVRAHQDT